MYSLLLLKVYWIAEVENIIAEVVCLDSMEGQRCKREKFG